MLVRTLLILCAVVSSCNSFAPISKSHTHKKNLLQHVEVPLQPIAVPRDVSLSMGLFDFLKRNTDGSDDDETQVVGESSSIESKDVSSPKKKPFFAAKVKEEETTPSVTNEQQPKPAVVEVKKKEEVLTPDDLRAKAARIRLEADREQVELTLSKIAKLTNKLEVMKTKDTVNAEDQQTIEEELKSLQSKIFTDENGDIKPVTVPAVAKVKSAEDADSTSSSSSTSTTASSTTSKPQFQFSEEDMKERVKRFDEAPEFMKVLVAKTVGFGVDGDTPGAVNRLNSTDIVRKLMEDEVDYKSMSVKSVDFANDSEQEKARSMLEKAYNMSKDMEDDSDKLPVFTDEQIQAKLKEIEESSPKFLRDILASNFGNNTQLAVMMLEEEYREKNKKSFLDTALSGLKAGYNSGMDKSTIGRDGERMDLNNRGSFSRLFSDDNNETSSLEMSDVDFMINSLYPASTRKEDNTPDKRQVDAFLNDIVATTKAFTPSSDAMPVSGGWIIRGQNECKSGDELIEKLDRRIANDSRLREKISFYVLKDPFPDPEQVVNPLDWPSVLFVAGPDVAREPQVILRTILSSVGIATAWYGSIYPFLANSKLLDRATEAMNLAGKSAFVLFYQMNLSVQYEVSKLLSSLFIFINYEMHTLDAGMPTDMSWLSEMSIPLFLSFMGLQISHEVAHLLVAKSKKFEITIPTLVPSIMTGITNSITSLKSSPMNKKDLVEFAVAGPLVGMIGSIILLCYGLALTATADPATISTYPGLPLAILRTSSLGGGLVDIFLGNGVLNVPASAEGAQALASTLIALHPFAVAGFFSLFVNALSLVPVGRTDGGRISQGLFGRSGSQAVSFASLAFLLLLGFTQSDLLLFYFAFVVFFQSELEIPMRNEVDDVPVTTASVAALAGFLTLLTLIPMG